MIDIIKAIIIGIIEGITEWLPISSTGHMILVDEFLELSISDEFKKMFFVVIQLGAILAVPVVFWKKLWPFGREKSSEERKATLSLWCKVLIGVLPAAVIGLLFDDWFDEHFYNYAVVAVALIVYGVAFLIIERSRGKREYEYSVTDIDDLKYSDAIKIGLFQTLALIPGTSRSGSTILGGMLCGVNRTVSAEFSFFMAIPVMLGASLLKTLKFLISGFIATKTEILILLIGITVSFIVSLASIRFLMDFVKRHSFSVFGVYRIILGIIILMRFALLSL